MKKIILLLIIASLLISKLEAQTPEKIIAKAYYELSYHYDTINPVLINMETFDLSLGENSSVYKSYDKVVQDSIMKAQFEKTKFMAPPPGRRASSEEIFIYFQEKKLFTNVPSIAGNYVVERTYPTISWSILAEKKTINGYQCQKAVGDFHGRNYAVWFTNRLPFKAGPWKLTGLPGLIIEAEDSTGRIKFELINFKVVKKSGNETHWSKETSIISWIDYVKIAKVIEDDPIGYLEKKIGGNITVNSGKKPNHYNPMLPKKSINFPLEAIEYYTQK
jgi:GLPGLI family protein